MSDFESNKDFGTTAYPVHANGTSGLFKRVEPLLTPAQLKSRYLKGIIPLLEKFGITYTDEELKDKIQLAANAMELELKTNIFPEQHKEKHPFDPSLYRSFIHIRTEQGPILAVQRMSITSSDGQNIFNVPAQWLEASRFSERQVNVIPLLSTFGTQSFTSSPIASGGLAYLSILLNQLGFVPSYWQIIYTAGVCNEAGQVPMSINELIGLTAAMEILSGGAALNINNSVSLSQDSISQSTSSSGPQIFMTRIAELEKKRAEILGQVKRVMSKKIFLTNI